MKKKLSNFDNAVHRLRQMGFVVTEIEGKYDVVRAAYKENLDWGNRHEMTKRQIINFAKVFSSSNNQNTALKRIVKNLSKAKDRSHLRNILNSKKEDAEDQIPQNKPIKKEDGWNWD